ncbi:MAG: hypothetical protein Q7S68_00695, partial [Deltaproteobacteria bacterium]|nr:hypothetical protein [Deltaproteobacteria bacterium]
RVTVSNDGKLYSFNKEGKVVAGWPKDFSAENRFFSFKPRLVDIDFDLQDEVVAVSQDKNSENLWLHIFKGNGQEVLDWRFNQLQIDLLETPIIADVNHDSSLDVIFATKSNHVYVYRRDFNLLKNFTLDLEPHISVGDPDNNGLQDLYVASGGTVARFDPLQNELVSFPVPTGSELILGNISFEDVNHDSYPDLIYATTANHIVVVDRSGQRILNIQPPEGQTLASGVAVEDIDLDREPEIIVLTETQDILAFETNGTQVAHWHQPLLYRQPLPEGGVVANDIYQGLFSTATGWDLYTIYRNKLGGYSRILLGENVHDFDTKADFQFVEAVQVTDAFAFPKLFTPNSDGVNDAVQIHYRLSDDALVALDLYDAHERFLSRIFEKTSRGAGEHQETINGLDTKGTTTNKDDHPLDTGAYIIKVVAQSKEGFVTSSKVSILVNGLKAEIELPRDGATIFGKVTIQGVATDPNFGENNLDADFKSYKIYYRAGRWNISEEEVVAVGQNGSGWIPLPVPTRHQCPNDGQKEPIDTEFPNANVSCRPVQHGVLGVFDASSPATTPNGEYTILLKTLDSNGNTIGKIHYDTVIVNVSNPLGSDPYNAQDLFDRLNPNNPLYQGPHIAGANLSSRLISRENPSTTLTYTLQNETSNIHVDIFPVSGGSLGSAGAVYSFNAQAPNTYNFVWDGKNTLGRNLDGGHYRVRITANAIDGTGVDVNESLEFDVARGFSARDILAVQSFVATPNHINPFNFGGNLQSEKMSLEFGLTKEARVTLQVFDRLPEEGGVLLKTLMADQMIRTGGVLWDGTGNNGVILEAGRQYLVRLRAVGVDVGNDESVHQDIIVSLDQPTLDVSLNARLEKLVGDVGEEFLNDGELNAMVGSPDFIWRARATGYVEVPFDYVISAYGDENYTRYSQNQVTQPVYQCRSGTNGTGYWEYGPRPPVGGPGGSYMNLGYPVDFESAPRAAGDGFAGKLFREIALGSDLPLQSFDVVVPGSGAKIFTSQETYSQTVFNLVPYGTALYDGPRLPRRSGGSVAQLPPASSQNFSS